MQPSPVTQLESPAQEQPPVEALVKALGVDQVQIVPDLEPIRLEGERRLVTVVIADVKGSTDLLEQIGTEAWVEIMNRVLHILESEVYRYGGEVDQFRGDGLVAFFGATSTHEDDPERAVLAALAMQEAIKPYAAELAESQDIELLLRIGLNSGEVIVASIGDSRQHSEDTAMGEAITLATRMEAAAEPGTVLVSENTYHMVDSQFEWQPLGEITVKGISQPVAVYGPLAPRSDVELSPRLRAFGLSTPLIGREEEFQIFGRCVHDLADGRGGIVMLTGDEGMGKSFLVAQVRQHFMREDGLLVLSRGDGGSSVSGNSAEALASAEALERGGALPPHPFHSLVWLQARCRSYEQSRPYSVWIDLLRRWLDIQEGEPVAETRNRLCRQAEALWGTRLAEHYPYLAALLSLPLEDAFAEQVKHLSAEGLHQRFFFTLRSWAEEMARRGPLVLVFGDMHWIDATSLDVVKYCLSLCEREMLLWVFVFRPERASLVWEFRYHVETEYPHRMTALTLPPLTEAQSGELIDGLIGVQVLPAGTRDLVLGKAEGNPYYIEQFIHSLIREGILVQDTRTGQWHATRAVASLELPDTLQSMLSARIDGLLLEERHVLQVAAVIGSVFWSNVLQVMVSDPEGLREHLTALQRAQLIYEGGRDPVLGKEYIFRSTLICDAAYAGILRTQRIAYHHQVAEYLVQLGAEENLAQRYYVVAYHYRRAEEHEKELRYARAAAEQAQEVYANAEALQLYTRVLELLDEMQGQGRDFGERASVLGGSLDEYKLAALRGLGQVYFGMGQIAEAEARFRRAISLGQAIGLAVRDLVRLYYWLGESLHWQDRYDDQIHIGEEGLALLGEDTESFEAALMNQEIASGYTLKGDGAKFREFTQRTARFIQRLSYSEELRPAYDHIAIMYAYQEKDVEEAMKWLRVLEQEAEKHYDLRALGEVHLVGGEIAARRGDLHEAVSQLEQALQLFTRIEDAKHKSWCLANMGRTFLSLGDLAKAEEYARMGLKIAQSTGIRRFVKSAYWSMARIFICQEDHKKAVEALQRVAEFSRETGDRQGVMWVTYALGNVYLTQGNRQAALDQFSQAIALADTQMSGQQILDFAAVLSGLESASEKEEAFRVFSRRLYKERGRRALPFSQVFLKQARVTDVLSLQELVHDTFAESLVSDWVWQDPFDDCSLAVCEGLEIHAANGRDLWHINRSAPRVVRSISGDWIAQTVCVPVLENKPAIGGLLLWKDEENYLCLYIGRRGKHKVSFMGCLDNSDMVIGRGQLPATFPQRVFLRLERRGRHVDAFCSVDEEQWLTVGRAEFPAQSSVEVGLHAIGWIDRGIYHSAYPDGTAIRFESFQLWGDQVLEKA